MNCRNSGERAKLYASTDAVGRRRTTHLAGVSSAAAAHGLRVPCHDPLTALLVRAGIAPGILPPLCTVPTLSSLCHSWLDLNWNMLCYMVAQADYAPKKPRGKTLMSSKRLCLQRRLLSFSQGTEAVTVPRSQGDSLLPFKAQDGVATFPSVRNLFFPTGCFHKGSRI